MKKLYKYRGVENIEYALDIFVNKRLHAAHYKKLNDPMEGYFVFRRGTFSRELLREIRGKKSRYKILSLSKAENDMLMWSYYGEGHKGFVVGVKIIDRNLEIEEVKYVSQLKVRRSINNIAKHVLKQKLNPWVHEKEYRVFTNNESFVNVEITDLIFGIHTDPSKKELISKIALKFCPNINIKTLSRNDLVTGNANPHDE